MNSSKVKKIFIVDDDILLTETLTDFLAKKMPSLISVFATGEDCLRQLNENPDIIILDYHLNSKEKIAANGMQILEKIKTEIPAVQIIMFSSQESYSVAVQTIKKGAVQYVVKDESAYEKIAKMIIGY